MAQHITICRKCDDRHEGKAGDLWKCRCEKEHEASQSPIRLIDRKTPNKGIRVKRTEHNPRELAIAEHWADECEPKSFLNYGQGLVQNLFMDRPAKAWHFFDTYAHIILSRRERMIAATCIQWLGSPCGFAFLEEALRKCGYTIIRTENK